MKKPQLRGNKAVFEGPAYDVKKAVRDFHRVVCATMDALGVKEGKASTKFQHLPTAVLPHPGLEQTEQIWERVGREFDVVNWQIFYELGAVTFTAYMYGKGWCVYRPDRGDIVTSDGLPLSVLNNAPIVAVGGRRSADGAIALLPNAQMDMMDEVLRPFRLKIDGVQCNADEGHTVEQKRYLSHIAFPHAVYGAGRRELKACCVLPDGSEIKLKHVSALN